MRKYLNEATIDSVLLAAIGQVEDQATNPRGQNKVYLMSGHYVLALLMLSDHFYNLSRRPCHNHPILYLYIHVYLLTQQRQCI